MENRLGTEINKIPVVKYDEVKVDFDELFDQYKVGRYSIYNQIR